MPSVNKQTTIVATYTAKEIIDLVKAQEGVPADAKVELAYALERRAFEKQPRGVATAKVITRVAGKPKTMDINARDVRDALVESFFDNQGIARPGKEDDVKVRVYIDGTPGRSAKVLGARVTYVAKIAG